MTFGNLIMVFADGNHTNPFLLYPFRDTLAAFFTGVYESRLSYLTCGSENGR